MSSGHWPDACHRGGIEWGVYYSQPDWYHPDYRAENHDRYIEFLHGQMRELLTDYGKVSMIFFDGLGGKAVDWDAPRLIRMCRRLQPHVVINNRAGLPADYDTPEQRIGKMQTDRPWETCMTICRQWAWKPNDRMKSRKECLQTLIRVVGGDGNLLFNVGPMPDGRIEPRQVERLKEMGQWLKRYGLTIFDTRGGPFVPGPWGASTYRGRTVFVHLLDADLETARAAGAGQEDRLAQGPLRWTGHRETVRRGDRNLGAVGRSRRGRHDRRTGIGRAGERVEAVSREVKTIRKKERIDASHSQNTGLDRRWLRGLVRSEGHRCAAGGGREHARAGKTQGQDRLADGGRFVYLLGQRSEPRANGEAPRQGRAGQAGHHSASPEGCMRNTERGASKEEKREKAELLPEGGPITKFLGRKAKQYNTYIIASYDRKDPQGRGRYNSAVLIDRQGKVAGVYDKMFPTIGEMEGGILPGKEAKVFDTDFGRIGAMICFDLNFEELLDEYKRQGVELLCFLSAFRGGDMVPSLAVRNQTFIASAVPNENGVIVDPLGRVLAESSQYGRIIFARINLDSQIVHIDYNHAHIPRSEAKVPGARHDRDSQPRSGLLPFVLASGENDRGHDEGVQDRNARRVPGPCQGRAAEVSAKRLNEEFA